MIGVIGSDGFIGSRIKHYVDSFLEEECIGINRENYSRWADSKLRWSVLVWAAGSARKDLTREQLLDTNWVALDEAIRSFNYNKFIYISSQAVYPSSMECPDESAEIDPQELSDYGESKWLGEQVVKECKNWLIIRPNGFVGPNLKKNVIHSLAKDPPELYYSWDSRVQFLHTDVFAKILFFLSKKCRNEIINVTCPAVVTPVNVANAMGLDIKKVIQPKDRVPPHVRAVMDTSKMEGHLGGGGIELPSFSEMMACWNDSYV